MFKNLSLQTVITWKE